MGADSTGPVADVLIGPRFKPFYRSHQGKDSPDEHVNDGEPPVGDAAAVGGR